MDATTSWDEVMRVAADERSAVAVAGPRPVAGGEGAGAAAAEPVAVPVAGAADVEETDELGVEEISIDGMCGVY